jgi:hypothetical protein
MTENATHWGKFEQAAASIKDQTEVKCKGEFELLTSLFGLYSEGFDAIPQSDDGEALIVRFALLSQTLNTFKVMIEAATTGFYIQSLIPLRHVYESWLSFWYLAKHPQDAERWLNPTWDMRPPNAETMRKLIDHSSRKIKSKLQEFHKEMHRFAHIDPSAVLSRLDHEGDKTIIGVGITLEAGDFRACTYAISLWLGNCLDALSSMIPIEHEWYSKYQTSIDRILAFIDEYNTTTGGIPLPKIDNEENAG